MISDVYILQIVWGPALPSHVFPVADKREGGEGSSSCFSLALHPDDYSTRYSTITRGGGDSNERRRWVGGYHSTLHAAIQDPLLPIGTAITTVLLQPIVPMSDHC